MLMVIDGYEVFQSFLVEIIHGSDVSGLLHFNKHGIHHGHPSVRIRGFQSSSVRI